MKPPARRSVFFFIVLCLIGPGDSTSFASQLNVTGQVEFSGNAANRSVDYLSAVVWLTPLGDSQIEAAAQRRQLVQKQKSFSPHLLVIPVGSTVDFPNNDPFFHNVFSLFEGKRFDLGLYEAGSSRGVVFNRAGVSYIFCNIHPEMSAVVVALHTPFHGISNRKGAITISNVPPGRYEMKIWHERVLPETLNKLTRTIEIAEGSSSLGVLRLPEQRNLTRTHKNKYGKDYDPASGVTVYTRP